MSDSGYRKPDPVSQPDYLYEPYRATVRRAPRQPLVLHPETLSERTGPVFGPADVSGNCGDLTRQHSGEPLGERIIVTGRVVDDRGRSVPKTLIEIWQANAAGRYLHKLDQHNAPLDPNFSGEGHTLTDEQGRYRFITIRPGSYPWGNHYNAWRPAHIHLSLFGPAVATRLVTQMYFPGDPMLEFDPIFECTADEKARRRLIAQMDWETTVPREAVGFHFNIILRGSDATPMEDRYRRL